METLSLCNDKNCEFCKPHRAKTAGNHFEIIVRDIQIKLGFKPNYTYLIKNNIRAAPPLGHEKSEEPKGFPDPFAEKDKSST